jgi:uracil-DNA glycosylase
LWDRYAQCEACLLHRYRRIAVRSIGNETGPLVVFILDRLEPQDLYRGQILQGDQQNVLEVLLSFLKRDYRNYYYVSPVACPTRWIHTIDDLVPLPKVPEVMSCRPRVLSEIGYLQPHVVVACGQSAVKCALPKKTPQVLMSAGSMFPMSVPGHHVPYQVPVMVTNSLHTLGRLPEAEQAELWHETCQHLYSAISVAEQLHALQGESYGRSDP